MLLIETPTSRIPAERTHRRLDIQGLRAVAVLLVVVFHAGVSLPGGFVGVDVFFVVSGFVITGLLLREQAANGRISLGRFYVRRARRLMPALAVVSVATLVAGALLLSPLQGQREAGLAAVAATMFTANGYFFLKTGGYFQPQAETNPFLHTWSLSVEEQFYLVFPVLLLLGLGIGRWLSHRWLATVVVVSLTLSLAACLCLTYDLVPGLPERWRAAAPHLAFYTPVARAWEFLVGVLVAMCADRRRPGRRTASFLAGSGACLLVIACWGISADSRFPGVLAALPVGATACILLAGHGREQTFVTRILSTRPAVLLGDLSYAWYLWHWPAIVIAKVWFPTVSWAAAAAAAGSLVPAVVSHRLVERPIHRGTRLTSRRVTAMLVAACVGIPLATGYGLVFLTDRSWYRADVASFLTATTPLHIDQLTGCATPEPLGSPNRPQCLWTVPDPRGTVLLIGDSNAGHLAEATIRAGRALGYDVQITTTGGCPFLLRERYTSPACARYVHGGLAAVRSRPTPYSAVIVSNASVGYLNGPLASGYGADAPHDTAGGDRQTAIAGWTTAVGRTVAAVRERSPVVVIGAIPQFPDLPRCLVPTVFADIRIGCGRIGPDTAARVRSDIISAERAVVDRTGGGYLDTGDVLCSPAEGCSAFVDGRLVYRDGSHLSVPGSMIFEDPIRDVLVRRAVAQPVLSR